MLMICYTSSWVAPVVIILVVNDSHRLGLVLEDWFSVCLKVMYQVYVLCGQVLWATECEWTYSVFILCFCVCSVWSTVYAIKMWQEVYKNSSNWTWNTCNYIYDCFYCSINFMCHSVFVVNAYSEIRDGHWQVSLLYSLWHRLLTDCITLSKCRAIVALSCYQDCYVKCLPAYL